jgi:hypothetical protein
MTKVTGTKWLIEHVNGEFEVYQGRRRKRIFLTYDTAERWLQARVDTTKGETVTLVEVDGYRVNITRKFTR